MSAETSNVELSALLQQGTREFSKLYERHAYRVYNLALRVTCERDAAVAAAERAFLAQSPGHGSEDRLIPDTLTAALAAAAVKPKPQGAGGADAQRLLEANAALPPAERAALALAGLADADPPDVAKAMELTEDAAAQLLWRALEQFGTKLGKSPEQANEAYRSWLWAEPPQELWEGVYQKFYRQLERDSRAAAGGSAVAAAGRRAADAVGGGARRLGRVPKFAALALLLAGAGVAVAKYTGGDSDTNAAMPFQPGAPLPTTTTPPQAGDGASRTKRTPYTPLTPQQVDALRRRELDRLNAYRRQQADSRLPRSERDDAARQAAKLVALARRREQAALLRERKAKLELLELRRRKIREEQRDAARRRHEAGSRPQEPSKGTPAEGREPTKTQPKNDDKGEGPRTKEEAEANCLFNEDAGTYICPE